MLCESFVTTLVTPSEIFHPTSRPSVYYDGTRPRVFIFSIWPSSEGLFLLGVDSVTALHLSHTRIVATVHSTTTSTSPEPTVSPTTALTRTTLPALGDLSSFCI